MRGNMNLWTLIVLCLVLKQTNESTWTGIMNNDHKIVTTKDIKNKVIIKYFKCAYIILF